MSIKRTQKLNVKRLAGPSEKPKSHIAKPQRIVFNPHPNAVIDPFTGEARVGRYAHFCYDYDEMLIDETDPEFENCVCGVPNSKT